MEKTLRRMEELSIDSLITALSLESERMGTLRARVRTGLRNTQMMQKLDVLERRVDTIKLELWHRCCWGEFK